MYLNKDLLNRLNFATSSELLTPIVQGKYAGGLSLGERLQSDLVEPEILKSNYGKFQKFTVRNELTDAALELIRSQPASIDVSINLFSTEVSPELEEFQASFLETCFLATTFLYHENNFSETRINDIIRIASSVTPAGVLARGLFTDFTHKPFTIEPPGGGFPGFPGLSEDLFIKAETLQKKGCVGAVKSAMNRWGFAMRNASPVYLKDVIEKLDPSDNCPGEEMTILGHDLGYGGRQAIVFTAKNGGILITPDSYIKEWEDDHITLIIPKGAIRGPIGIISFPDDPGDFASAGGDALAEIGDCFGPDVIQRMGSILGRFLAPPIFAPSAQSKNENLYLGGPPIINSFTVNPSGPLWPGKTIRLAWTVEGATYIEIAARNVAGSAPQELPAINGTLPYAGGSVSVSVPGSNAWKGQYVLRAFNKCNKNSPEEQTLDFDMVLRRGLALGGGGSRGDFQTGALLYLYNEKNYRPDAISGTSVGAINAIDLVMGDDAATSTSPAQSAASRLAGTWLSLVDETSMWGEEQWLTKAKSQVNQTIRSLSIEGLLTLPYTVTAGAINVTEFIDVFRNPRKNGVVAIFNLGPIEARARSQYQQGKASSSGIKLRLVSVSLETGELVMVNETGMIIQRGPQPRRPSFVPPAPQTDVVDGAMASSIMPGIFPARRLGDHMCVDGGVKEIVPVQVAVRDLGCNDVIAIHCHAPPPIKETDPTRSILEVMARGVLELTFDAIAGDDIAPYSGWGESVNVKVIRPSFNLHDPMVIEPGLIRIALDYGWMRAADVLDVPENKRQIAMDLSDKITRLRTQNWILAHEASGTRYEDPHRGFTDFVLAGVIKNAPILMLVPDPIAVDNIRANCRIIRDAIIQRLLINAPTPPSTVRTDWFTKWEMIDMPPISSDPWAEFISISGNRDPETPPDPV